MVGLRQRHVHKFKMLLEAIEHPGSRRAASRPMKALGQQFGRFGTRINRFVFPKRNAGFQQQHFASRRHEVDSFSWLFQVVKKSVAVNYVKGLHDAVVRIVQIQLLHFYLGITLAQHFEIFSPAPRYSAPGNLDQRKTCMPADPGAHLQNRGARNRQVQARQVFEPPLISA